ncbi:hypothetical protein DOY81_003367 [Sarcophaga bullata]|nr:hypothetical protein DOY81_003367 [Sarcophaga bullata]
MSHNLTIVLDLLASVPAATTAASGLEPCIQSIHTIIHRFANDSMIVCTE